MIVNFLNINLKSQFVFNQNKYKNNHARNISFGLNANNRQAIYNLHQNPQDKIEIIRSFDMTDPDIAPCIAEFSHLICDDPSNSPEMNAIIDQLNTVYNKDSINDCLSGFIKSWTKLFLSTRTKVSEIMDELMIEHPPVGYLSRTATNPLYKDFALENIENAQNYIIENVERGKCPDKELLINLHKIITANLPYVAPDGTAYASKYYSGIIKDSAGDIIQISSQGVNYDQRTDEFMTWLERNYDKEDTFHLVAQSYKKLLGICPFYDANGRTIRCFIDALLYSKGYCLKEYPVNYAEFRNMKTQDLRQVFELNCTEI